MLRQAIQAEMTRRKLTVYKLWKLAREHAPTITQTAIGEFLKGDRAINSDHADALLRSLGLKVRR